MSSDPPYDFDGPPPERIFLQGWHADGSNEVTWCMHRQDDGVPDVEYVRSDAADEEIERLRAIVDKLTKTADGVPVVPGMMVWCVASNGIGRHNVSWIRNNSSNIGAGTVSWPLRLVYSTPEAARAAREGEKG